jgi:hypothetical protein
MKIQVQYETGFIFIDLDQIEAIIADSSTECHISLKSGKSLMCTFEMAMKVSEYWMGNNEKG